MKTLIKEYNELAIKVGLPRIKNCESEEILLKKIQTLRFENLPSHPDQRDMVSVRGNGQPVQKVETIVTRAQAIALGYVLYWNGQHCEKGHVSPRYTKSGHCKQCYQLFRAEEIQQTDISKDKLKKGGDKDACKI